MSQPLDARPTPDHGTPTASAARRLGPSPWPWMIAACLLVAASGIIRVNQEQQFADAARQVERSPFPMRDLPAQLGDHWQMVGEDQDLGEETLQVAGCSDYMYRRYIDGRTGVTLTVLVAFGPAERVFPHSPLVCFPANGFEHRAGPWVRTVPMDGDDASGDPARFNALVYGRPGGGVEELEEVYYAFRHDDRWSPGAVETRKYFRHRPAMIKVQVERPVVPGEIGTEESPIDDFLAELLPEIERRLADGRARG